MSDTSVRSSREDTRAIREWARENGHEAGPVGVGAGAGFHRVDDGPAKQLVKRLYAENLGWRVLIRVGEPLSRMVGVTP
jgi:hypothetical protein